MDGPAAALRPLEDAAADIDRLRHYESAADLAGAVAAVHAAMDRALRILLRADSSAPDAHRMAALSERDFPLDDVVRSLRTRDLISLETAGTVHELGAAAERARSGDARPADADVALRAVSRLREDLAGPANGAVAAPATAEGAAEGTRGASNGAADDPDLDPEVAATPPERRGRSMALVGAGLAVLIVAFFAWVLLQGPPAAADEAIRAFRAGRMDSAAAAFERVLEERPSDIGARLYLGRIHRRKGRLEEAAAVLRDAARLAPSDAGVRRELGHLFMDLGQPRSAIQQYERALEGDPESVRTWAGLIRALRAAGDPRAERMLTGAPAEVQALFGEEEAVVP